ncbi:ATP-dependent RNA helicase RhlB [Dissulfuribacter thermophilus]|uniref:ATP-dependent RNA helicase RhlB n=1 Tax=Dissulfuribacter thermophilus TaxID=1156395 RepID=A0A1B9F4Q7_9BACT|nr:DEAD/DEAH box helicase [Dissulfuribacter thermophilus]OCC14843.1 ATP-dependent RNA helicase RhlB [Dissulfuribacter thermophilus]
MSFEKMGLSRELVRATKACGFEAPMPVQEAVIPHALLGKDIAASARTGSGKTASFVLPMLQRIQSSDKKVRAGKARALILAPTRELAMQIAAEIEKFGKFISPSVVTVVGGEAYGPQIKKLQRGVDIIVATPGRLIDLLKQRKVDLSDVSIFVMDEADRLLSMGFLDEVMTISSKLPDKAQKLLFSATLQGSVDKVIRNILKEPIRITLTSNSEIHTSIKQKVFHAHNVGEKTDMLTRILKSEDLKKVLIFTATKRSAKSLAERLNSLGYRTGSLHGDMSQPARRRAIDSLRRGRIKLMVATDVAARGLDILDISHVINFDLPMVAEDYIHRIGRTGRAGSKGTAISFVGPQDRKKLSQIERLTGRKIS